MAGTRNHASPMEWTYDNEYGPSDPKSPWSRQNIERQLSFGGPPRKRHIGETVITPIKDRQFGMTTPSSKPFFFSSLQNPLDSSAFKTPRDFASPSVYSEAEDSPVPNVAGMDSMMTDDTPTKAPLAITEKKDEPDLDATPNAKPKKQEGKGLFESFGFLPAKKSNKGETKAHKFSDKAAKKVEKRRRRRQGSNQNDFWTNSGDSYDDEDSDSPFAPATHKRAQKVSDRTWAETHRDIPQVLSQYLQLMINVLIASLGVYVVYLVVITIQKDVSKKVEEYTAQAQLKISDCALQWTTNRCQPDLMVPAMAEQCMKWKVCSEVDPYNLGRSQVSAETFAEIINGFVEPISYKSMVFCFVLVFGCLFVSNFAFGFFRAKVGGHPAPVMAAAAPRFVEYGGAAGVVHSYPATIFATPAPALGRVKNRGRSRSPTKGRTPFFTARKAVMDDGDDGDYEGEEPMSPTITRKRVGW